MWKKDGTAIPGATGKTFSKTGLVVGDTGAYTVEVTDAAQAAKTSTAVQVTVTAAAPTSGITAKAATKAVKNVDADIDVNTLFTVTGSTAATFSIANGDSVTLDADGKTLKIDATKVGDTIVRGAVAGGTPASAEVTITVSAP